ncbi:hypothetical protein Asp14428_19190 [Actinoplanes sp. NBRC 14428]|nr:hypothetical protein Asp14428_19190 [Actinoplanes sp. NBRC 14428]
MITPDRTTPANPRFIRTTANTRDRTDPYTGRLALWCCGARSAATAAVTLRGSHVGFAARTCPEECIGIRWRIARLEARPHGLYNAYILSFTDGGEPARSPITTAGIEVEFTALRYFALNGAVGSRSVFARQGPRARLQAPAPVR